MNAYVFDLLFHVDVYALYMKLFEMWIALTVECAFDESFFACVIDK